MIILPFLFIKVIFPIILLYLIYKLIKNVYVFIFELFKTKLIKRNVYNKDYSSAKEMIIDVEAKQL